MKKITKIIILSLMLLLATMGFVACKDSNVIYDNYYDINFIVDNKVYTTIESEGEEEIILPKDPKRTGYDFAGWFFDKDIWSEQFTKDSLISKKLTSDLNVYAKFDKAKQKIKVIQPKYIGDTLYYGDELPEIITSTTFGMVILNSGQKLIVGEHDYNWTFTPEANYNTSDYVWENLTGTISLTVEKKILVLEEPVYQGGRLYYGDELPEITTATTNGIIKLDSNQILLGGEHKYSWTFTPDTSYDLNNYQWSMLTGTITLKVEKANQSIKSDVVMEADYISDTYIELKNLGDNFEYSLDETIWQASTLLSNLNSSTEYTIFARLKEDSNCYVSASINIKISTKGEDSSEEYFIIEGNRITGITELAKLQTVLYVPSQSGGTQITEINFGIFRDCINLTKIVLPFVGGNLKNNQTSYFGYIFGTFTYTENIQHIPESLKTVIVTGGDKIYNNTFRDCVNLETIVLPANMTAIGTYAFAGCKSLKSIDLPKNITNIGAYVFADCEKLVSVNVPLNVISLDSGVFSGCISLENITLPNGLLIIGSSVFSGCTSLKNIEIPKTVTAIGSNTFYNCKSLTKITLPFVGQYLGGTENTYFAYIFGAPNAEISNTYLPTVLDTVVITNAVSIEKYAFQGCVNIKNISMSSGIIKIGNSAFSDTAYYKNTRNWSNNVLYIDSYLIIAESNIASNYTVKTGTELIADYSFNYNSNLKAIEMPTSLKYIGDSVFRYCDALTSVKMKNGLAVIGEAAFDGCKLLTNIEVPSSVIKIGSSAFRDCSKLELITLPFVGSVINGTDYAYFGYIFGAYNYNYNDSYVPKSLKTVIITGGKVITKGAFINCSSIETVVLPDSLEKIGENAFLGTAHYNNQDNWQYDALYIGNYFIKLSDGYTGEYEINAGTVLIADSAFIKCINLTRVTIPEGLEIIGDDAFSECRSLTDIVVPDSVVRIGYGAFYACNKLESITLPFVGETKDGIENTHFAYIFRAYSYGSTSINSVPYVPTSLKTVIIQGGTIIAENAFYYCENIESIVLPKDLKSIGDRAFYYCMSLESIEIPESVTSIGLGAFNGCSNLNSMILPFIGQSKDSQENNYFSYIFGQTNPQYSNNIPQSLKTVVIKDGTIIADYAFYNCSSLKTIELPSSIVEIGISAFYGCASLQVIEFAMGLTSIGERAFYNCSSLQTIELPSSVVEIGTRAFMQCTSLQTIEFTMGITSIGEYAFFSCSSLQTVELPSSVVSIGYAAFDSCSKLTSITVPFIGESKDSIGNKYFAYIFGKSSYNYSEPLPTSLKRIVITEEIQVYSNAFYNCNSVEIIELPNNITAIGAYAFYNCKSLKSIVIPNSVTDIGRSLFDGCTSLTTMTLPFIGNELGGITNTHFGYFFGMSDYNSTNKIPSSLKNITITKDTTISAYAFYNCNNLQTIELQSTITKIGKYAFYSCSSLQSINIPQGVEVIEDSTFSSCTSLQTIELPSGITTIGESAFFSCTSLQTIELPSGITTIGESAFVSCNSLQTIELPSSITNIGYSSFKDCTGIKSITLPFIGNKLNGTINTHFGYIFGMLGYNASNSIPSSLKNVTLTVDTTTISEYAFYGCSKLESIELPQGVTTIGKYAFYGCSKLNSIELSQGIATIGEYAFSSCSSLNSIELPQDITTISEGAFASCSNLYTVTLPQGLNIISEGAFFNCISLQSIVIPDSVTDMEDYAFGNCTSLTKIIIPSSLVNMGNSTFSNSSNLTIYCRVASAPSTWHSDWNYSNLPVVWSYTGN